MSEAKYPKRPKLFAVKFCRLMANACLANQIGHDACWLLAVIAHTEDARRYRGAVTFWNEQLRPLIGAGTIPALLRTRAKAVASGWLHYEPGAKGRAARYWVVVPKDFEAANCGPTDEDHEGYFIPDESEDSVTKTLQKAEGMSEDSITKTLQKAEGKRSTFLPIPIPNTSPTESGTADAVPAAPGKSQSDPAKTKPPKPSRKPASGPHHEAIRAFCEQWAAKYGAKYPFSGGKDAPAVEWMLKQVDGDVEKFASVVGRYLADADRFYADDRHSLGKFRSQFQRWLVSGPATPKPYQPAPGVNSAVEQAMRGDVAPPMSFTLTKRQPTESTRT